MGDIVKRLYKGNQIANRAISLALCVFISAVLVANLAAGSITNPIVRNIAIFMCVCALLKIFTGAVRLYARLFNSLEDYAKRRNMGVQELRRRDDRLEFAMFLSVIFGICWARVIDNLPIQTTYGMLGIAFVVMLMTSIIIRLITSVIFSFLQTEDAFIDMQVAEGVSWYIASTACLGVGIAAAVMHLTKIQPQ